jgi:hypothetical protein
MRRLLLLFALIVAGTVSAKDPPAGRPEFDLSLLSRSASEGVIALRPAELAEHAGGTDDTLTALFTQSLKALVAFLDGTLKGDSLPAAADVEQLVLGLKVNLTLGKEGENGTFGLKGCDYGYARTVKKFDWAGMLKEAFPKAEAKKHAGVEYMSVQMKLGKHEWAIGFYFPDDRTVVFDLDASELEKGLTRKADDKPADPPAGWEELKACSVAFVWPAGDRSWVTGGKELSESAQAVKELVDAVDVMSGGLTVGKETPLVLTFTATSADAAADTVMTVVSGAVAEATKQAETLLGGELDVRTTRDDKSVRVEGAVKANLIKHLIGQMTNEKK